MAKIKILNHANETVELPFDLSSLAEAKAADAANTVRHMDGKVFTGANPSVSQQIYAAYGLGRPNASLYDLTEGLAITDGRVEAASTQDAGITGRLVTSAYLMDTIENNLRSSDYGMGSLFVQKAAINESINSSRFERPVINFAGPEGSKAQSVAQLSEPNSMVLLTASDKSFKIANKSIGIEFSDDVAKNTSLAVVSLSMQRQAETQATAQIEQSYLGFLQGDADLSMAALSAVTAASFDPTIVAAGNLTQKAWMSWLFANSRARKVDTVYCDLASALAIQNRAGRPNVNGDNPTSKRIDTLESVINPTWADNVDVIVIQDPSFPANTIVGFDSKYGYHNVISTSMAYNATEQLVMRRSTKMRVDYGSIAYRLFDDAWTVLTLTV